MNRMILLALLLFGGMACDGPSPDERIRVEARAIETGNRLKVRLSIVNPTREPQEVWIPSRDCTNQLWSVNVPGVSIRDYDVSKPKAYIFACEHQRMLAPGARIDHEVEPTFAALPKGKTRRKGRESLVFTLCQPNTDGSDGTPNGKAVNFFTYKTAPIEVVIRPQWWP